MFVYGTGSEMALKPVVWSAVEEGTEDVQMGNWHIFNLPTGFHGFEEHDFFAFAPQTAPLLSEGGRHQRI
jgi:hypothetical protein